MVSVICAPKRKEKMGENAPSSRAITRKYYFHGGLYDNAEREYQNGRPIFVKAWTHRGSITHVGAGANVRGYEVSNLNHYLETAQRKANGQIPLMDETARKRARPEHWRDGDDDDDDYQFDSGDDDDDDNNNRQAATDRIAICDGEEMPLTPEAFREMFTLAGVLTVNAHGINGATDIYTERDGITLSSGGDMLNTVQWNGRWSAVANMWGPDVVSGSWCGFEVRPVSLAGHPYLRWDNVVLSTESTRGLTLQVIPRAQPDKRPRDAVYRTEPRRQIHPVYARDPVTGLLKMAEPPSRRTRPSNLAAPPRCALSVWYALGRCVSSPVVSVTASRWQRMRMMNAATSVGLQLYINTFRRYELV